MQIEHYLTADGRDPFQEWLDGLKDLRGRIAVLRRIERTAGGNLGDHRYLHDGVAELRIDTGPGYRVYFGRDGERLILLLCGGDKGSQARDIDEACRYWSDWKRRSL